MPKEQTPTSLIIIGKVGAPHGVKGAVTVTSFTAPKEKILQYRPWKLFLHQQWVIQKIKSSQAYGQDFLVHFENVSDREQAKLLTNTKIAVERKQLPTLPDNEYYWHELIGLNVVTLEGVLLGTVQSLIETGSNDVLIVRNKEKEHLIPYLPGQFIKRISLEEKRIEVDWDPHF